MKVSIDDLVEQFGLQQDVDALVAEFVKRRVKELATSKNEFYFRGHCTHCGNNAPHVPHATGKYNTPHERLEVFCPGSSGATLGIVGDFRKGDAQRASQYAGFWFVHEPTEAATT